MENLSLDELLDRIKAELVKLAPIIDFEVTRDPEGSRTKGGLTWRIEPSSTAGVRHLSQPAVPSGLCCGCRGRWLVLE
jgi:hypothetical protein